MISQMKSKFRTIHPHTAELAVFDHLKKILLTYNWENLVSTLSLEPFRKFTTELRRLINIKILSLIHIFRMNVQNLTNLLPPLIYVII